MSDPAPPAQPDEQTSESLEWRHWWRVAWLLLGIPVVVAAAAAVGWLVLSQLPDDTFTRSTRTWVILVAIEVAGAGWLLVSGILTKDRDGQPGTWLTGNTWRLWIGLGALLVPTVVFGQWATPSSGDSIVRLELAGSQGIASRVPYPNEAVIHEALRGDYGFIAGYVLVLFLLVRWAGCYFRLEPVRHARIPVSFAVVAAGSARRGGEPVHLPAQRSAPDGQRPARPPLGAGRDLRLGEVRDVAGRYRLRARRRVDLAVHTAVGPGGVLGAGPSGVDGRRRSGRPGRQPAPAHTVRDRAVRRRDPGGLDLARCPPGARERG